jgi:hypothetical protein
MKEPEFGSRVWATTYKLKDKYGCIAKNERVLLIGFDECDSRSAMVATRKHGLVVVEDFLDRAERVYV